MKQKIGRGRPFSELIKGSYEYTVHVVSTAFYQQFPRDYDLDWFGIVEVFEDHLIVRHEDLPPDEFYYISFSRDGETISFTPRSEWEVVELNYQPKTMAERRRTKKRFTESARTHEYESHYAWTLPGHHLSERQARVATQVLHRIPVRDLAELQRYNVTIESEFRGLFYFGEMIFEHSTGRTMVYICPDSPLQTDESIAGSLVHELAHARLRQWTHISEADNQEAILRHEREANALASRWGFADELGAAYDYLDQRTRLIRENIVLFK